jgi:hypothetical protein
MWQREQSAYRNFGLQEGNGRQEVSSRWLVSSTEWTATTHWLSLVDYSGLRVSQRELQFCLTLPSYFLYKPKFWQANYSACRLFSRWCLAWHILWPWRWRRHVPPKRRLTLNGLHDINMLEGRNLYLSLFVSYPACRYLVLSVVFFSFLVIPFLLYTYLFYWGHAVAHLVEALCYKPEGRGFECWWDHCIFQLT